MAEEVRTLHLVNVLVLRATLIRANRMADASTRARSRAARAKMIAFQGRCDIVLDA